MSRNADEKLSQILHLIDRFKHVKFHNDNSRNLEYRHKFIANLKSWLLKIVERNYEIKTGSKKESKKRRRQNVFCLDFGVNIGSEFNYFHFCVVVKEFDNTAIVVPISTEKEDDAEWKSAGNLVIPIGVIEDMPYDKKPCYAMVNQIKTVSKSRLTDYFDNRQKKHFPMTLNENQMKLIFNSISSIGEQKIIPKKEKSLETV